MTPAAAGVIGLPLPQPFVPEGRYKLHARLQGSAPHVFLASEVTLELAASPWEDAPPIPLAPSPLAASHPTPEHFRLLGTVVPDGFQSLGTVAPTELPDRLPDDEEIDCLDLHPAETQGLVVFAPHPLEKISPGRKPLPGEAASIRVFGCPGQYLSAVLCIRALQRRDAVSVTPGQMNGDGEAISPANTDVRVVRTINGLPAFLEKRPTIDIPANETRTFWLTFYIPLDVSAGMYHGFLMVAVMDEDVLRVPIQLRVLPLTLPASTRAYGFWWNLDTRWKDYESEAQNTTLEQVRKQFTVLREHGCNLVSIYSVPEITRQRDGGFHLDFEREYSSRRLPMADLFRIGLETGLFRKDIPLQYTGAEIIHRQAPQRLGMERTSAAFKKFYRQACEEIDRWASDQGVTLAFACVDEIGNSGEKVRDALYFYEIAACAGVLTSVTDNSMWWGFFLSSQPRFQRITRLRLLNYVTPELLKSTRGSGGDAWLFNMAAEHMGGPPCDSRDSRYDRFVFGLFSEACGAGGCVQWAFQWPAGNRSPYEAAAAGEFTGSHYALPSPDGPLPTPSLEAVREGIDDARYLELLRRVDPSAPEASLADIFPSNSSTREFMDRHSGLSFEIRRWQIARAAMRGG